MCTSIVIADDHPVVLHGLASLIEADPEFSVVGRCEDGIAALAAIRETRPNLAVLDLNMPGMTGREVLAAIVREELGARVVLLTAAASDAELYDTIDAGAAGGVWLPDDVVGPAMDRETARRDEWRELSAELTARELEIVRLVLQGSATKEISFRMN